MLSYGRDILYSYEEGHKFEVHLVNPICQGLLLVLNVDLSLFSFSVGIPLIRLKPMWLFYLCKSFDCNLFIV